MADDNCTVKVDGESRRSFLGKAVVGGTAAAGAVWMAPSIMTVDAAASATVGNPNLPPNVPAIIGGGVNGPIFNSPPTFGTIDNVGGGNAQVGWVLLSLGGGADSLLVTPDPGAGPAWTQLIRYDSSSVATATDSIDQGLNAPARLRLLVWYRIGTIPAAPVRFDLSGVGVVRSWKQGVVDLSGVAAIADDLSEALAVGSGVSGTSTVVGPAISNDSTSLVLFIGGANGSTTAPPTLPASYSPIIPATSSDPVQPSHVQSYTTNMVTVAPLVSALLDTPLQSSVGAQILVQGS